MLYELLLCQKKKESNLVLNLDIGLNFFETEGYL